MPAGIERSHRERKKEKGSTPGRGQRTKKADGPPRYKRTRMPRYAQKLVLFTPQMMLPTDLQYGRPRGPRPSRR